MTGVRAIGSAFGFSPACREFNASGTFAARDFVKDDGSTGEITVATATHKILGVANEAGTSSSTDVQVNVTPYLMVLMDNDNEATTFAATHVNEWADFIGATGAMYVDSSSHSTTVAQLLCLAYNPQGYGLDSDTSIGKYMVEEQYMKT